MKKEPHMNSEYKSATTVLIWINVDIICMSLKKKTFINLTVEKFG